MQTYGLDAWLGEARADLTDEQYARLFDEARDIETRYPDQDDDEEREAALSAALRYLLGEATTTQAGAALTRARIVERAASITSQQVARMAVQDGASEAGAAREAGLDRMTVRKALGKS